MRPLRIAVNAMSAVTGGGLTYWNYLLPEIAALGSPHSYLLLMRTSQPDLCAPLPSTFEVRRYTIGRPLGLRRALWEQTTLPGVLREWGADVLFAPFDMAPLRSPCPFALGVQNSNPYYGPRGSTWRARLRDLTIRRLTAWSAARAARVFFVSDDSRRRIMPLLGVPERRTVVIHHGIGEAFLKAAEIPASSAPPPRPPYILSVSGVRVHKDFETLLRAFAALRKDARPAGPLTLRIAGSIVDETYYQRLKSLIAELSISDAVSFVGELPHGELPALYRFAELFVLPSFAETFGFPLLEAMACGVPVVASDLGVAREVCGDAAAYYAPGSADSLLAEMRGVLSEDGKKASLVAAGRRRASEFSWEQCARKTLGMLEDAARGAPPS